MATSQPLPVLMPTVPDQRWSCHSCGNCCRTLVGHLFPDERDRIEQQNWGGELGVAPMIRVRGGWVLNKNDDGACVFLDEQNRCLIHAKYGEQAKPIACRVFPFSLRPVRHGWQASLRFDCPSVTASDGAPIGQHRAGLVDLSAKLYHPAPPDDDVADLARRMRATVDETDAVVQRFARWIDNDDVGMRDRLVGAAQVTGDLARATLTKIRGPRLAELLDLLVGALPGEGESPLDPPDARQRALLRQLVFAHTEHVTLQELRAGACGRVRQRWRQLRIAARFRAGEGVIPTPRGLASGDVPFAAIDSIQPDPADATTRSDLLRRYLLARLHGRTAFGRGYYGWPVFTGLAALWLSTAVAGWLARYRAASERRDCFVFDDLAVAIGVVDRAATRAPSLGTLAERTRAAYLLREDGVARLVNAYDPT